MGCGERVVSENFGKTDVRPAAIRPSFLRAASTALWSAEAIVGAGFSMMERTAFLSSGSRRRPAAARMISYEVWTTSLSRAMSTGDMAAISTMVRAFLGAAAAAAIGLKAARPLATGRTEAAAAAPKSERREI